MHTRPLKLKLKHHLSNYNRALSDYLLNYSGLWCRSTDSKSAHRQGVALCIRLLSICVVSAQVCAKYVRGWIDFCHGCIVSSVICLYGREWKDDRKTSGAGSFLLGSVRHSRE